MTIESSYEFLSAWPKAEPPIVERVIEFWKREGAVVDPEVVERRVAELLVVAVNRQGEVAAVSTASRRFVEQLGFDCFYYRTFVGAQHRRQGLASKVLKRAHRVLEERFEHGEDPGVLGILIEAQSPIVAGAAGEASWERRGIPGCVFIGWSSSGLQLRVWYFAAARLPAKRPRELGRG